MKKKATARSAKATSRQSTLNFPTSSEADLVAESPAAVTSTKSGAKNRRKRTADFADDADKHNESHCDSSVPVASAPMERNKIAQGKKQSAAALGQHPSTTESPEGATQSNPLPHGWQWSTVEELCDVVRGGSPRPAGDPRYFGGDIPWITVGPITADNTPYLHSVPQTITALGKERSRFVGPGTLLLTNSGATLGVPKITLIGGCINDGVAALLNVPASLKLYLLYFLQTQTARLRTVNQGAAQPNLNTSIIKAISVPVAPPAEQHRIVAEIEKQFTRLDAGVAALKRVQANLKCYRAAVLKAACEGKLVPTEAELRRTADKKVRPSASSAKSAVKTPPFETGAQLLQRILTERRQNWQGRGNYNEPIPPETAGLPPLPDGWCYTSAEQVCSTVASGSTPLAPKMFSDSGEVPFLKVYNLTNNGALNFTVKPTYIERETHEGPLARSRVFPRDVLMNIVGPPLGKVSFVPDNFPECNINQAIVAFRPTSAILNKLLTYWLLSDYVLGRLASTAKATAGQFNLQVTACRRMALPLPPLAEQTRIVAEVERRLSVVDELEAVVSANLQRAARLRQSILQKAFTGELV